MTGRPNFGATLEERTANARKAGKAAHASGRAHQFNAEEAREAGKKGGAAVFARMGRAHMQTIGRKGGQAIVAKLGASHFSMMGKRSRNAKPA